MACGFLVCMGIELGNAFFSWNLFGFFFEGVSGKSGAGDALILK